MTFFGNVPIGEWANLTEENVIINSSTQETELRKKKEIIQNTTTLKGSINYVFNYLKTNYPTKQIICLIPIHRGYAKFSDTNIQYAENYSNSLQLFFEEYIKTIKEGCLNWSIPFIDLYNNTGLYPLLEEYSQYFSNAETDMLHPNENGHQRIANVISRELNKITPIFTV